MPSFPALVLTAGGLNMQAQAEAGGTLQFTRIALGAGAAADPTTATALVDQRITEDIQSFTVMGGGNVRVRAVLSNLDLATGFSMTEVGLFARDPTTHVERLYSYSKTTTPDFMPAYGAPTLVEQILDIIVAIGSAATMTAIVDDTVMIATKWDTTHPTNQEDLATAPTTATVTARQMVNGVVLDGVKTMGFGGLAIPIALGAVPTPPDGWAYLYVRTNGLASPNRRLFVCTKLPDGNDAVLVAGDPS